MEDLNHYQLGKWGENKAESYLRQKNYQILERNFRVQLGELDMIAREKRYVVFMEVKTRRSKSFGLPRASVNRQKRETIRKIARIYLSRNHRLSRLDKRFDVLGIQVKKDEEIIINHYKNAF